MRKLLVFLTLALLVACNTYQPLTGLAPEDTNAWKTKVIPPSPQPTDGDPAAGLDYLIHGDYIGSGIPLEIMQKQSAKMDLDSLYPRNELNEGIPYYMTAFIAPNGAETVNGNCFTCHAGEVDGELVLGLGNSFAEWEKSMVPMGAAMRLGMSLKYKKDDPETVAFEDFGNYFQKMAPTVKVEQPGANPAFRLAEACMMHRNPEDLTYVEEPLYEMWGYNIGTDTPPLWHVGKKNSLYYTGTGRGAMSKLLLQASVLGVPDSSQTRKSEIAFRDVYAFLSQLEAPAYPGEIDEPLAREGEAIFTDKCAGCHGTYGAEETYPNKVVNVRVVKTDSLYAQYIQQSAIVDWYNSSWFATSEPQSSFEPSYGYVAPPLDGIWASAPYLHNGSVPTVYELLKSDARPDRWTRDGKSTSYDHEKLGWQYDPAARNDKWTFDTTVPGYGNGGHTFGDRLSEPQRWAVVEYLKTL